MSSIHPVRVPQFGVTDMPMNVLEVVLDDYGRERDEAYFGDPGITGTVPASEIVVTPTLRRLYQQGVRFRRFRPQPWCSPARALDETGRWGFRTGIVNLAEGQQQPLLLDEMCKPRMLKLGTGGAVATGAFGKHHLATAANGGNQHPNLMGYDYFAGTMRNLDTGQRNYFQWDKVTQGVATREYDYPEAVIVADALRWIREQGGGQWYCKVAFHLPHQIEHRPPPGTYDAGKYVLKAQLPSAGEDPRTYHAAMIQAADFYTGELLAGIDSSVLGQTMVIVWSDNGTAETMLPDVLQAGGIYATADVGLRVSHAKRTVLDYGVRTPMVITGPLVAAPGRVSDEPISAVDLYSTVAGIMGADLSKAPSKNGHLDSISFLAHLLNPSVGTTRLAGLCELFSPNGANVNATSPGTRCVWDRQYKIIRTVPGVTFPNATDVMCDGLADPNELVNLIPGGATGGLTGAQLTAYNALVSFYTTTQATL